MVTQQVPIQALPNQQFSIMLDNNIWDFTIKATNDGLNRAFSPVVEAQRPALSLVNGVVYIGFGGPFGDFAVYFGWVIAVDTKNPATIGAWSTRLGEVARSRSCRTTWSA